MRLKPLLVVVLVVVAAVVVAQLVQRSSTPAGSAAPSPSPSRIGPSVIVRPPGPTATTTPATSAPTVPDPTGPGSTSAPGQRVRSLSGEELARTWLLGYLTRPDGRHDGRWKSAIADLTSPELMALLADKGPDFVGLFKLTTWQVAGIVPYKGNADVGASGPSRQVLAFTATVTDGRLTFDKPFILTAYAGADGRFVVSTVEQPYTSEG